MTSWAMRGLMLLGLVGLLLAGGLSAPSAQVPARTAAQAPSPAERELAARIRELGHDFDGEVGIAVRDIDDGFAANWHGDRFYPQQSVSKFWVALTALQRADAGQLDLDQRVTVTRSDLTLFHQPIAGQIGENGYTTTLGALMYRALTQSDNTCNDIVLRHAGGPSAVRAMLERNRLDGVRFGPGERLLQAGIAGLHWQPAFSLGNAFFAARQAVADTRQRAAFEPRVVRD